MIHILKTWPGEFEAVLNGGKAHEVRDCSDRDFKKGHDVILAEYNPAIYEAELAALVNKDSLTSKRAAEHKAFTGRRVMKRITYVTKGGSWGLPENICVFSFK